MANDAVKSTPGPWRVSMSGYSVKSNDDDMPIIAQNPWGHAMREKDCPRWLANAEIIAAAPSLLDEVDTLCQAIEGHRAGSLTNDGLWHYRDKARRLLAELSQ